MIGRALRADALDDAHNSAISPSSAVESSPASLEPGLVASSPTARRLLKGGLSRAHSLSHSSGHGGYSGAGASRWGHATTHTRFHRGRGHSGCHDASSTCRGSYGSYTSPGYYYGPRAMHRSDTLLVVHRRHHFQCYTCYHTSYHNTYHNPDTGRPCLSHFDCKAAEAYTLLADHDRYELDITATVPRWHAHTDSKSPWPLVLVVHGLTLYGTLPTFAADGNSARLATTTNGGALGNDDADARTLPIYATLTTQQTDPKATLSSCLSWVGAVILCVVLIFYW